MNKAQRNTGLASATDPPAFVDRLLGTALAEGYTDLYLLPGAGQVAIRGRAADGTECGLATIPADFGTECVARIKVLAGMLTYRTASAQDGAIHAVAGHPAAEARVATMPTRSGERVTIRLFSATATPRCLDELGFADSALAAVRRLLTRPFGLTVLTGPTGSGKTTTIYAMLRELLAGGVNPSTIITIEDPVETVLDGISQVQVRHGGDAEWGYAQALRAALRHDVKTLVIGELRDAEVVKVALDAALTGHRIITTYHAGDVPSVYARMLHQGFEPFLVAAAVTGVVVQRLLPRVDGGGMVPVAAVLEADDAWREFLVGNPGLGELRKRVRQMPEADIEAAARRLADDGRIAAKDALLV